MEPPALKDELKSVTIMFGALSVMTRGLLRMPMWPVDNLDLEIQVKVAATLLCCTELHAM